MHIGWSIGHMIPGIDRKSSIIYYYICCGENKKTYRIPRFRQNQNTQPISALFGSHAYPLTRQESHVGGAYITHRYGEYASARMEGSTN